MRLGKAQKNAIAAVGCVAFVFGAYSYTVSKMKTVREREEGERGVTGPYTSRAPPSPKRPAAAATATRPASRSFSIYSRALTACGAPAD